MYLLFLRTLSTCKLEGKKREKKNNTDDYKIVNITMYTICDDITDVSYMTSFVLLIISYPFEY